MQKQQTLRKQYLSQLRHHGVTVVSLNGFQLNGNLLQFDSSHLILTTKEYGQRSKKVLCANFVAVIPHTQPQKITYEMQSHAPNLRLEFLKTLEDKLVSCITPNGFRLSGTLVAYDDNDIIVETERYGGLKHVLLTSFSTVLPEE